MEAFALILVMNLEKNLRHEQGSQDARNAADSLIDSLHCALETMVVNTIHSRTLRSTVDTYLPALAKELTVQRLQRVVQTRQSETEDQRIADVVEPEVDRPQALTPVPYVCS